ncbi:MAG: tRNA pseudouridine(38-40) synthase TruA [Acidobacteria bacterium]|nr:tRNA pseudouridine(38-40) synthase TruA [Acidobacteriota bacterium]
MERGKVQRTAIKISYDGSSYFGWQKQKEDVTIQSILEDKLKQLFTHHQTVHGSGRTDAGVHAVGQVAHFNRPVKFDLPTLHRAMSALLPDDIRVISVADVNSDFHSRFSAVSKTYLYTIDLNPIASPFNRNYSLHYTEAIDIKVLKQCLDSIRGTHDFRLFTTPNAIAENEGSTVREVFDADYFQSGGYLFLKFSGQGFLRYMVRILTGFLLRAASGKISAEDFKSVLNGIVPDLPPAQFKVKPQGLFLVRVEYKEDIFKDFENPENNIYFPFLKELEDWL